MTTSPHPIYTFFVTLADGTVMQAASVQDAIALGVPDYYGVCSGGSVLSVGRTVLSTLINGISVGKAGNDVNEVMAHYSISGNEYEQDVSFYLYPLTKRLYLHALHTGAFAPYVMRKDNRADFQQGKFIEWIGSCSRSDSQNENNSASKFFAEFQSILPMLFLAWHLNQPEPLTLIEHHSDVYRTPNGNVVMEIDPEEPL